MAIATRQNRQPNLSSMEEITLSTYERTADSVVKKYTNPDFWKDEFTIFASMLRLNAAVLDAGCGVGRDAHLFLDAGLKYIGADISPAMLAHARKRTPEAAFVHANLYHLSFPAGSFDGFWAATSLLHTPKDRVGLIIKELRRVTRTDGAGFIALKEGDGERFVEQGDDKRYYAFYQQDEFKQCLEKAGLAVERMERNEKELPITGTTYLTYWCRR